jgi:hypothetical protein
VIERPVTFQSANFAGFSFKVLNHLLLTSSVLILSEDALLKFLLNLAPRYQSLNHIQLGVLCDKTVSLLGICF